MSVKNISFDPTRDGFESTRFRTTGGAPVASGDQVLLSQAGIVEKNDVARGDLTMRIVIPVAPTAGDLREFGMKNISSGAYAMFVVDEDAFYAKVSDQSGNTDTATLEFDDDWVGSVRDFRIVFQSNYVKFLIEDSPVAIFGGVKTPRSTMSVYVNNSNADSMLFKGYDLLGAEISGVEGFPSEITVTTVTAPSTGIPYADYQNNSFTTLNVKATPGRVYSATVTNTTGDNRYFQLFNTTTTPAGGATATYKVLVPANGAVIVGQDFFGMDGSYFDAGIAIANSTTAATYTAGSAGDLLLDMKWDGVGGGSSGYLLMQTDDALLMQTNDTFALHS